MVITSLLKRIQFIVFVSLYSINSFAQITPDDRNRALQEQNRLQNEQEKIIQKQIWDSRKNEILQKPTIIDTKEIDDGVKKSLREKCFQIDKIELLDVTLISRKQQSRILKPYLNQCIGLSSINDIVRDLTNFYIEKGYITSKIYIPPQDMKGGVLKLKIVEGFIEEIRLNNKKNLRSRMQVASAFPGLKGKKLNLRDLEQGIDQMNRLSSNDAKLNIKPGEAAGASVVDISNNPSDRLKLGAGYSNAGQESTGKYIKTLAYSSHNLLALNDVFNLIYNKDHGGKNESQQLSESLYANLSIPFGYWTISGSAINSKYLTEISGNNQIFTSSGSSDVYQLSINRALLRSKKFKLSVNSALKLKDSESYIRDTRSDVGSRKLTILDLGVASNFYSKYGVFYLRPIISRGLSVLNAKKDAPGIPLGTQHAQFQSYKLYAFFNGQFKIPKTKIPFSFSSAINSQFSSDELFGSESFYLGGQYSVRGFKEESVQSESGAYMRNDLKFNLAHLFNKGGPILPKTTFVTFYDTGFARPKGGKKKFYMSGAGLGLSYSGKHFSADFSYAKHINKPNSIKSEGGVVYFEIKSKIALF